MKFIIGKKQEMTQIFSEDNKAVPVTRITVEPCFVVAKKTAEKHGYNAISLACGESKKIHRAAAGFFKKVLKKDIGYKKIKEFRLDANDPMFEKLEIGNQLDATVFADGDNIFVKGISKGKGFQGVVKRHGFSGSPASHGHKDQLRMPGSIGATGPAHVFKGTRMGGHMGDQSVTVKNLQVIKVEDNNIFVKGAIPGCRGGIVYLVGEGEFEITERGTRNAEQQAEKEKVDENANSQESIKKDESGKDKDESKKPEEVKQPVKAEKDVKEQNVSEQAKPEVKKEEVK